MRKIFPLALAIGVALVFWSAIKHPYQRKSPAAKVINIRQTPTPSVKTEVYENREMGFRLNYSGLETEPIYEKLGRVEKLSWKNWRNIEIMAGTFFDGQGRELDYEQLAGVYGGEVEKRDLEKVVVDGYQAIKAIYTSKYGQDVVGLLAIKRPDRIYLVTTEDVDSLDKIIEGWKWLTYDEARLYYPTPLDERNVVQIGDTISGKISQFSTLLLDTRFGVKQVPYSRDDYRYYLSFLPGKIKNAEFFLDGAKTGAVYGFAQYPDVECDNSFTEGGMSTSWGLYRNSVHHQPLISQEECVAAKREELPPVLFFFKNQGKLGPGKHELKIVIAENWETTIHFVTSESAYLIEEPARVDESSGGKRNFEATDSCASGYYYDENFLHIPMVKGDNVRLRYVLSFPQSEAEKGITEKRDVGIVLGGNRFDLIFPEEAWFYLDGERNNGHTDPEHSLFLPTELLIFPNGEKARVWDPGFEYYPEYFEVYPATIRGKIFIEFTLPWRTTNSSSCDG